MTGGPHPMVAIMTTERRRGELLAEADGDRLMYLAQRKTERRPPRTIEVAIVVAFALVLALSKFSL